MVSGRGVVALRLGLATIAVGVPPRRVGISERVVAAIGVAVEGLGACRVLHVGVHREEAARKRIVAAAVHVNQAEGRHVFVASITPIKHRGFDKLRDRVARPSIGVAKVAPGIEAQFLLNVALVIGYRGPRAEVVLQDVVDGFLVVLLFYHSENAVRAYKIGERLCRSVFPIVLCNELAKAHIVLGACYITYVFHHADALLVVAVGVGQRVAAFGDGLHLVEARVRNLLGGRGEHAFHGLGTRHGVGS